MEQEIESYRKAMEQEIDSSISTESEEQKEEYRKELQRTKDLYDRFQTEDLKELLEKSIYTTRQLPLEDNPINALIYSFLEKEEAKQQNERLLINVAQNVFQEVTGKKMKISYEDALQILSHEKSLKILMQSGSIPSLKVFLDRTKPTWGDVLDVYIGLLPELNKDVKDYIFYYIDSKKPIHIIKKPIIRFLRENLPDDIKPYTRRNFLRKELKRALIPEDHNFGSFKTQDVSGYLKDFIIETIDLSYEQVSRLASTQEERYKLRDYYEKVLNSVEKRQPFFPTKDERDLVIFNPWFIDMDSIDTLSLTALGKQIDEKDFEEADKYLEDIYSPI